MRIRNRILILILFDADPYLDPTFHSDAYLDPYPDPSVKPLKVLKLAHIPHILAFHLQIDADPDPVPDPACHFNADPDPDFYLMWIPMRIRIFV